MATKRIKLIRKIFSLILLVIIILSSLYITNKIKEQFPSIKIESSIIEFSLGNETKIKKNIPSPPEDFGVQSPFYKSELHNYCQKEYNYSHSYTYTYNLDDTSIRGGDPIIITSNVESNKDKLYREL